MSSSDQLFNLSERPGPTVNPKVHPFKRRFQYFDHQLDHPDWSRAKVLDFGGSAGNVLKDPLSTVVPENYFCLDVVRDAVDQGAQDFPKAHWFHYDRYNFAYNIEGVFDAPFPQIGEKFDFILAFSVFTHMTEIEMLKTIREDLVPLLKPEGRLAFSLFAPEVSEYFFRQRKSSRKPDLNVDQMFQKVRSYSRFLLVDSDIVLPETRISVQQLHHSHARSDDHLLVSFYDKEYVKGLFPKAIVKDEACHEIAYCVIGGPQDFGG